MNSYSDVLLAMLEYAQTLALKDKLDLQEQRTFVALNARIEAAARLLERLDYVQFDGLKDVGGEADQTTQTDSTTT